MRDPQLGYEPGKSDEQWRIQQALGPEQRMTPTSYPPKPKRHNEHDRRIIGRFIYDRLAVDAAARAVAETEHLPQVILRL